MWKSIGKAAAMTAFALLIPLTAPIMTSCAKERQFKGDVWEKRSAKEAERIFSLSQAYAPSGVLAKVAKAMDCRLPMPYQKDPFVGYYTPYGLILSTPGITAKMCLKKEKGFEKVDPARMARKKIGKKECVTYDLCAFPAESVDCFSEALRKLGIEYQLLYNSCYFEGRDQYSKPAILFSIENDGNYVLSTMGLLCFFLPSDVVILIPGSAIDDECEHELLRRNREKEVKENIFFRLAGPSELRRDWKRRGEPVADAWGPLLLLMVWGGGNVFEQTGALLVIGGVAGVVSLAKRPGKVEEKTLDEIRASINESVNFIVDNVLGEDRQDLIVYFSKYYDQKGAGYGKKKVFSAWSVTEPLVFVDEGLLIDQVIVKKRRIGVSGISFDVGAPNHMKTTITWYDYALFNKIKTGLDRLGIDYSLAYSKYSYELVFVADMDPPVFIYLNQYGVTRSSYFMGGRTWFENPETGKRVYPKDW